MSSITIRNAQNTEAVESYWRRWQHHPNSDFSHFQLVCSLRQEILNPHILVVERDGKPCALVTARIEHTHFRPKLGYLRPVRIPAKVLNVVYQGLLGDVDEKVARKLVQHIRSELSSGKADAVTFIQLSADSPLSKVLLGNGTGWPYAKHPVWSQHWEMKLNDEPGFLLRNMKGKHRWVIRNRQKKLEKAYPGKVSLRWMTEFEDIPTLCAQLEEVAARTYQRGLGAGFRDDAYHRRRFSLFADRGLLRMQLLKIDGIIKAFDIGTVYNGVFYASQTGFDPDLYRYAPGTMVFLQMADELIKEGVRKVDFGFGDAPYKQQFGDRCWSEATVQFFAATAKGQTLRYSLGICDTVNNTGRRMLDRAGVLSRAKKLWRRGLANGETKKNRK